MTCVFSKKRGGLILDSAAGVVRAFICVAPEGDSVAALAEFIGRLRVFGGYKWVRAEGLHVTLKFLGDINSDQIQRLDTNLSRVGGMRPFAGKASGTGGFPSPDRPRTIWLGVREGADKLEKLAKAVDGASKKSGLPAETKKFKAHITLARARREADVPEDLKAALASSPELSWTCRSFILMKSVLSPGGSIYTPIREYHFE
jgi:2'-5' RNA ligase